MRGRNGPHQRNAISIRVFDNIKRKLYLRKLARHEATLCRQRTVHNLHTAKRVGIAVQTASEAELNAIIEFRLLMSERGIGTSVVVVYPNKLIPNSFLMRKDVEILNSEALSWLQIPTSPAATAFVEQPFDLLIDLSTEEQQPVRWLSALSVAQCKVGVLSYAGNPFDLIVATDPRKPMAQIVNDIRDILLTLNAPSSNNSISAQ